ncbi:MAG: hypothetical protein R3320_03290 [Nitriliruptorales bacterium]|nr:hypothetical protein [Nitriliruptorales bacterium]
MSGDVERDEFPTGAEAVLGVVSPGGPAAALAAEHLQGPHMTAAIQWTTSSLLCAGW